MNEQWVRALKWCPDITEQSARSLESAPFSGQGVLDAQGRSVAPELSWAQGSTEEPSAIRQIPFLTHWAISGQALNPFWLLLWLMEQNEKFQCKECWWKEQGKSQKPPHFVPHSWVVLSKNSISDRQSVCRSHKLLQLEWIINLK